MKTQLIMLDTPIIVSGEKIQQGDLCYDLGASPGYRNLLHISECLRSANDSYWNKNGKKIIAGIGGLPLIDWNGLEEEFGWVDVEKLAWKETSKLAYAGQNAERTSECFIWKKGFKKAQSLNEKKFSLEDIEKSIEMTIELMRNKYTEFRTHKNTILQSLQQPKVFEIEVETEVFTETVGTSEFDFMEQDSLRFKITNNSIKILKKL